MIKVVCTCNSNTWEPKEAGELGVQGQSGLQSKTLSLNKQIRTK